MFKISHSFSEARSLIHQHQAVPQLVLKKGNVDARYVLILRASSLIEKIKNIFNTVIALMMGYRKSNAIEFMPGFLFPKQLSAIKNELRNTLLKLNQLSSDPSYDIDDTTKNEIERVIFSLINSSSHKETFFKDEIQRIYNLGLALLRNISNVTYIEKNPIKQLYDFTHHSGELRGLKKPFDIDSFALKTELNTLREKYGQNLRNALIDCQMTATDLQKFFADVNWVESFASHHNAIAVHEIPILVSFLYRISMDNASPIMSLIETSFSLESLKS